MFAGDQFSYYFMLVPRTYINIVVLTHKTNLTEFSFFFFFFYNTRISIKSTGEAENMLHK